MVQIVNNVLPVFAVIFLGVVLNRFNLINQEFRRVSDRLAYFLLLPALLFWKVGGRTGEGLDQGLVLATLGAIVCGWLLSLLTARLIRLPAGQVGAFSQVCFRFNTYIGLAVCLSAFGDDGVSAFGTIIALGIPVINLLAVSTLIWHSGRSYTLGRKVGLVVRSIVTNPLIMACLLGLAYAQLNHPFPEMVDNTLGLLTVAALPLALISIGGGLSLVKMRRRIKPALAASLVKLGFMPLIGFVWLKALAVSDLNLGVGMVFFALASSPSSYILSSQLGSDADLAAGVIASTTLLSMISLSAVVVLFG